MGKSTSILLALCLALAAANIVVYRRLGVESEQGGQLAAQLKSQEEALVDARAALTDAQGRLRDAQAQVARLAASPAPVGSVAAAAPAKGREQAVAPARPAQATASSIYSSDFFATKARIATPEGREAYKQQLISSARRNIAGLGEALGLDEAGVNRFLELQAESNIRRIEQTEPGTPLASLADSSNTFNSDLSAAFGADVVEKYKSYLEGSRGRAQVRNYLAGFAEADVGLSKAQRQQLSDSYNAMYKAQRQTVLAASSSGQSGSMDAVASAQANMEQTQRANEKVLTDAGSYLSPAQLKVLQLQHQSQLDNLRSTLETLKQRAAAGSNPVAPRP